MPAVACAKARANVALVKYWGKRIGPGNLPAVGSLSLTLDGLLAIARVGPRTEGSPAFLNRAQPVGGVAAERMEAFLDRLRGLVPDAPPLAVDVEVNFPVGAGLASSAAIFCSTTAAALSVLGVVCDRSQLSRLAREGSGSAARSVHGGFVEWRRGVRPDGEDSVAEPLLAAEAWPLAMAVAVVEPGPKAFASRDAMAHVAATSPFFAAWVQAQEADLVSARAALVARDLESLGRITEENCLRMHATCHLARPAILYARPATLAAIGEIRRMRADGLAAWFTMDAGPQVKALCRAEDLEAVAQRLSVVPGVRQVLRAGAGPGVEMLEGDVPWR